MSADEFLVEEGAKTGLNYTELHNEYLKILLEGLEWRSKDTLELFAEWDNIFFPSTKDQGHSARAGLQVDSNRSFASRATDRAMERLRQGERLPERGEEDTN